MPAMMAIRIGDNALAADLAGFANFLKRPEALTRALGNELRNRLRGHFRGKNNREPNKLGGKRTNFWREVGRSVTPKPEVSADGLSVSVSITDPNFAQKLFGGTIRANKGLYLTIPVSRRAHGKTVANLERDEHIKLVFVDRSYGGMLIEVPDQKGGKVKVDYILKTEVHQEADPTALPDEQQLNQALRERAEAYVEARKASGWNYQEPTA